MNIVELRIELQDALRIAGDGCSDGNCGVLGRTEGQHTNGGCNCAFRIRRRIEAVAKRLKLEGIQPSDYHVEPSPPPQQDKEGSC